MTDQTDMPNDAAPASARGDADLVLRTRSGDAGAYAELWRRHYASGVTVARSVTGSFDADDLVQESFTRIYQAIQKGGGPTGSFRAYLFTSIRNTAAGWGRTRRETAIDELDTVADPSSTDQATNDALDRSLSAQAFRSLPSRWQEVLWYSEIEQLKPAEIAPLLGMTAGATAQLAFRAREGLREAWIQAHLSTAESGSVCEWTIERLGAYSRDNLGARDRSKLESHLSECARCLIVAAEAKEVSHRLAFVLLPLVLGVGGSGAYLAMLQSGSAPVVALAAMPSSVVQGAVVVGSAGTAAHGATVGVGSTGGTGGASGSTGTVVTGFGALVGAGSAALVIAGAIVAVAMVPGLATNPASTSAPSASDQSESGIVAQVSPPSQAPLAPPALVAPTPDPAPRVEKPNPVVDPPARTTMPTSEPAGNAVPVPPATNPGAGTGTNPDPGTGPGTDPGTDPGTGPGTDPGTGPGTDPGTGGPGTDPGTGPGTDPGTDPGTGGPGTDPGTGPGTDPGTDPGTGGPGTDPGTGPGTDPGTGPGTDPGTGGPGTDPGTGPGTDPGTGPGTDPGPALPPASAPGLGSATLSCQFLAPILGDITVTLPVSGVAGAAVRATVESGSAETATTTLDASGAGAIVLHPTLGQVNGGSTVTLAYVLGEKVGGSTTFDLGTLGPVRWWQCLLGTSGAPSTGAPATGTAPAPDPAPVPPVETPAASTRPAPAEPAPAPAAPSPSAPAAPPRDTQPEQIVPAETIPTEPEPAAAPSSVATAPADPAVTAPAPAAVAPGPGA